MKYRLIKEIIDLSESNVWDEAKREWYLDEIFHEPDSEECLCGHFPINEICIIANKANDNKAKVGNCCVKKFFGMDTQNYFSSIKRVSKNNSKSVSKKLVFYAKNRRIINDWEYTFYLNIHRKRNLSDKQKMYKIKINKKIMEKVLKD